MTSEFKLSRDAALVVQIAQTCNFKAMEADRFYEATGAQEQGRAVRDLVRAAKGK